MKPIIEWCKRGSNWNGVLHGVVGNVIFASVLGVGAMLWSYIQGQSGPWIVIAGVSAFGAVLWVVRQLLAFVPQVATDSSAIGDTNAMQQRLGVLEGELCAARTRAAAAEDAEQKQKKQREEWDRSNAPRIARLADTKAAITAQIDAAPKVYDFDEVHAWTAATDDLLSHLNLGRMPHSIIRSFGDDEIKKRFQQNVAFLRSLLVKLKYTDMPWH